MNLWVIFLTGLTTGGLSCVAMQGGLLASIIANQKEQEIDEVESDKLKSKQKRKERYLQSQGGKKQSIYKLDQLDWMPVTMFLLAKLISHTVLGFLLGSLGSVVELSLTARLSFQVFTAIFMLASAANLLDIHPAFRRLAFQPPRWTRKLIKKSTRSEAIFAPAIFGFLTVFIPCGVTQAMEVLAISTGSPIQGALIMFSFVLGTSPIFGLIGIATAKLSETVHEKFAQFAALTLVLMALYSINGVLVASDAPLSVQKIAQTYQKLQKYEKGIVPGVMATVQDGVQKITISVIQRGYSPNRIQVKKDIPVELTLKTDGVYSCASSFVFKAFDLYANLKPTDEKTFTFIPEKEGIYTYACSMGMYTGTLQVI